MEILIWAPEFAFQHLSFTSGQGAEALAGVLSPHSPALRSPQHLKEGHLTDEGERKEKGGSLEKEAERKGHPSGSLLCEPRSQT